MCNILVGIAYKSNCIPREFTFIQIELQLRRGIHLICFELHKGIDIDIILHDAFNWTTIIRICLNIKSSIGIGIS